MNDSRLILCMLGQISAQTCNAHMSTTAHLFGPALAAFIISSSFHLDQAKWHLFVGLEWCKATAHLGCWIRLSLRLSS